MDESNGAFQPPANVNAAPPPRSSRRSITANSWLPEGVSLGSKRSLEAGGALAASAKRARADDEEEPWSETIHRDFVEAIYDLGVKHASPAVIIENMVRTHEDLTSERVKSHLQKYRNNKDKSKQEFFDEYESWIQKALTVGSAGGVGSNLVSPASLVDMMGTEQAIGGDAAAFLTYSAMADEADDLNSAPGIQKGMGWNGSPDVVAKLVTGAKIPFPALTEEERKSPLGTSISHVVSLFYSMTQHLMKERALGTSAGDNSNAGAAAAAAVPR